MYTNEPAPALSEAWAGNGGGSGSTMGVTDCSLMVYRPPSKREDGMAAGVDAVGLLGGVWATQHVRYGHLHDSRPVHSPFTSLHCFGADSASGWASCSIGHIRLHLTAGWVPADLVEVVVVAAAETVAGVGGDGSSSRSDWRVSGMGVQAISRSQKKEKKRKKKKNEPLAQSGTSACTSQQAGCLWTWQRWWWRRRKWRRVWAAMAAAAGQTGGCHAWGFKPSVAVKKKRKEKK
jgi:hypothetical protein